VGFILVSQNLLAAMRRQARAGKAAPAKNALKKRGSDQDGRTTRRRRAQRLRARLQGLRRRGNQKEDARGGAGHDDGRRRARKRTAQRLAHRTGFGRAMGMAAARRLMETAGRDDALRRSHGVADRHGTRRGGEEAEALKHEDERGQARKPPPPNSVTPAIS
jgi:hypothetical protein